MKIKRLMAREGLIIIVFGLLGYSLICIAEVYPPTPKSLTFKEVCKAYYEENTAAPAVSESGKRNYFAEEVEHKKLIMCDEKTNKNYYLKDIEEVQKRKKEILNIGRKILFYGYPLYLLMRFIVWAIKTLKKKEA